MPKAKGILTSGKKRRGFMTRKDCSEPIPSTSHTEPSATSTPTSSRRESFDSASFSFTKITRNLSGYASFEANFKYDLVDVSQLGQCLKEIAVCRNCSGELHLAVTRRSGLASTIKFTCENGCLLEVDELSNSQRQEYNVKGKNVQLDQINLRLCYAMRTIGKGHAAARKVCALMNIAPPPWRYFNLQQAVSSAVMDVSKGSMRSAVEEACQQSESRDLPVSLDGTWQKRGHTSLNGIVSAASMDTGKIVDIVVLSKFCTCPGKSKGQHLDTCKANFLGTSGAMEVAGAKEIFSRSLEMYDVRYTHYLGDGDSKGFLKVVEMCPYGSEVKIEKLECVGHIQKRMGTRLRKLKLSMKNSKLEDAKPIGGKGRLTDNAIDEIQNYYGLAIRRNSGSLENMKKAVWALYFHVASSDQEPVHHLCDEEWCKFKQATNEGTRYKHGEHFHLPKAVMTAVKPIFRDLAHPKLLEKCLHGKTQNCNESFNQVVWSRVPKSTFVQIDSLRLGAHEAVAHFNEGFITSCKVLQNLGIEPGHFCQTSLEKEDKIRIKKSEKDYLETTKEQRLKRKTADEA